MQLATEVRLGSGRRLRTSRQPAPKTKPFCLRSLSSSGDDSISRITMCKLTTSSMNTISVILRIVYHRISVLPFPDFAFDRGSGKDRAVRKMRTITNHKSLAGLRGTTRRSLPLGTGRYTIEIEIIATSIPSTKPRILIATICTTLRVVALLTTGLRIRDGSPVRMLRDTRHGSRCFGANRPIQELESTPTHRKQRSRLRSNRPIFRNWLPRPNRREGE